MEMGDPRLSMLDTRYSLLATPYSVLVVASMLNAPCLGPLQLPRAAPRPQPLLIRSRFVSVGKERCSI